MGSLPVGRRWIDINHENVFTTGRLVAFCGIGSIVFSLVHLHWPLGLTSIAFLLFHTLHASFHVETRRIGRGIRTTFHELPERLFSQTLFLFAPLLLFLVVEGCITVNLLIFVLDERDATLLLIGILWMAGEVSTRQ